MTQDVIVPDWQQRVRDERAELDTRTEKLSEFIEGEQYLALPRADRHLLARQFGCMIAYRSVLDERIKRFGES